MYRLDLLEMALRHFNEPMLSGGTLVRCIGYAESALDCYFITKNRDLKECWSTCVGGNAFLGSLKDQHRVILNDGEEWDDLRRLEFYCCEPEVEFKLEIDHDDMEGFNPHDDGESQRVRRTDRGAGGDGGNIASETQSDGDCGSTETR